LIGHQFDVLVFPRWSSVRSQLTKANPPDILFGAQAVRNALILVVAILFLMVAYPVALAQAPSPSPSPTPEPQVPTLKPQPAGVEVDPEDVLRVSTTLVTTPALIIGRDRQFVRTLRREDFQIFDEGVQQELAFFAPIDKPFTVALVFDTSRSMLFDLQDLQDAANNFVESMRPGDRALIISFDKQVKVLAEPTSDRVALRKAIANLRLGGSSQIYDALDFVLKKQMDQIEGRKAVILFSDGVDNGSLTATSESNLRYAMQSDVLIYPVVFSTYSSLTERRARKSRALPAGSGFNLMDYQRADEYLHQLANATGVVLYRVADISDLGQAVAGIVEELHNEYGLGYYPKTLGQPGQVRRLEVRVNRPQLVVRARTSYVVDQSGAVKQLARQPGAMPSSMPADPSSPSSIGAVPIDRRVPPVKLPKDARWMCKGSDVPGNFVIVQEGFDSHCSATGRPNDSTNAWFIRKAGPSETVCKGFFIWQGREVTAEAIPTGYVVVGEAQSPVCSPSNDSRRPANAWTIKLPGEQEIICKGFAIPHGYLTRADANAAACPARPAGKNARIIVKRTPETRTIW
jgi:Ca-activated chloride channel family protein